jgi:hypothetical protein
MKLKSVKKLIRTIYGSEKFISGNQIKPERNNK